VGSVKISTLLNFFKIFLPSVIFIFIIVNYQITDVESTQNAWFGMNVSANNGIQPTTYNFIPVYTGAIGTGFELPFLSGVSNSIFAPLTNFIPLSILMLLLLAAAILYANNGFNYLLNQYASRKSNLILIIIFNASIFPIVYSYTILNDWWEIGIGFCAGTGILLNTISAAFRINKKIFIRNDLIKIIPMQMLGSLFLSLTHLGYLGALIIPSAIILVAIAITLKSRIFLLIVLINLLVFAISIAGLSIDTILAGGDFFGKSNVVNVKTTDLISSLISHNFNLSKNAYSGREIYLNLGIGIGIVILNLLRKDQLKELFNDKFNYHLQLILTFIPILSTFFVISNQHIYIIINPSINYLFRDFSVVASVVLISHYVKFIKAKKFGLVPLIIILGACVYHFTWISNTVLVGKQTGGNKSILRELIINNENKMQKSYIEKEYLSSQGTTIWADDSFWRNHNYLDAPISSEELRRMGVFSIGGWPKIRSTRALQFLSRDSIVVRENYIAHASCDVKINQFLLVDYVIKAKDLGCSNLEVYSQSKNFIWYKIIGKLYLFHQGNLSKDSICFNSSKDADCSEISQLFTTSKVNRSELELIRCKNSCILKIESLILRINETLILPVSYSHGLELFTNSNTEYKKDLVIGEYNSFATITNVSERSTVIDKIELRYLPTFAKKAQVNLQYLYTSIMILLFTYAIKRGKNYATV
jgi:hypothetical protein